MKQYTKFIKEHDLKFGTKMYSCGIRWESSFKLFRMLGIGTRELVVYESISPVMVEPSYFLFYWGDSFYKMDGSYFKTKDQAIKALDKALAFEERRNGRKVVSTTEEIIP
jgi:hypothetical protein